MPAETSIQRSPLGLEEDFLAEVGSDAPEEQLRDVERLAMEEVMDHLGYVRIDQNALDDKVNLHTLRKGIRQWRAEIRDHLAMITDESNELMDALMDGDLTLASDESSELTEEELGFLNYICNLEGGFALHDFSMTAIKSNPILTRVLTFRLSILKLIPHPRSDYNSEIDDAIAQVKRWLGIKGTKTVIRNIGDIVALSAKLTDRDSYPDSQYKHIVYFQHDEKRIDEDHFDRKRFKSRLIFLPKDSQVAFEERNKPKEIAPLLDDKLHNFVVRLVQVRLWLLGVYGGRLDNDIGPLSYEAIKNLVKYLHTAMSTSAGKEIDENNAGISFKDLVVKFRRKQLYALNATFLLGKVFPILIDKYKDKSLYFETIGANIDTLVEEMDEGQQEQLMTEIERLMDDDRQHRRRKTKMRGSNGFFSSVRNFFKKAAGWVKRQFDKVINTFRKIFSFIKNGVKVLLREIKKAIGHVGKTIGFIFSKRIITTQSEDGTERIVSDFDFDFDGITTMQATYGAMHIAHTETLQEIAVSIQKGAIIIGKALYVAINAAKGPLGWIKMGVRMVKLMVEHIKSKIF